MVTITMSSESDTTDRAWALTTQLFPFAFQVDLDDRFCALTPRLASLMGASVGDLTSEHFKQHRPARLFSAKEALRRTGMLVTLAFHNGVMLRGQFLPWDEGILFVGGPQVNSMDAVNKHGLRLSDFPPHDPRLDLLVLISTKETALADARRLTAQLQEAKADIEIRAEELSRELVRREAVTSLGRLVAGVAHEVNTPLGVSLTALSVLDDSIQNLVNMFRSGAVRRSVLNENVQRVQDASTLISTNVQRAAALVRNFKQVAVDQTHHQPRLLDLGVYVEQVVTSLSPLTRGTQVTVSVQRDEQVLCNVDPGAISQLITILLENAILHAFDDKHGAVCFSVRTQRQGIVVSCTDNGKGMSEAVRDAAMEPFYTTRKNEGGTGLGLFILQRLAIEVLHGHLQIDSEPGVGTTVSVVLPHSSDP